MYIHALSRLRLPGIGLPGHRLCTRSVPGIIRFANRGPIMFTRGKGSMQSTYSLSHFGWDGWSSSGTAVRLAVVLNNIGAWPGFNGSNH